MPYRLHNLHELPVRELCTDRPHAAYAYALTVAGAVLADRCYDAVVPRPTRMTPAEHREFFPLPKALHAQDDEFIRRMARCFDDLTSELDNGEPPQLHNLAEQLEDDDHVGLLEQQRAEPRGQLDYLFEPFYDNEARAPTAVSAGDRGRRPGRA